MLCERDRHIVAFCITIVLPMNLLTSKKNASDFTVLYERDRYIVALRVRVARPTIEIQVNCYVSGTTIC